MIYFGFSVYVKGASPSIKLVEKSITKGAEKIGTIKITEYSELH